MPTIPFATATSGNTVLVAAPGVGLSIQLLGYTLSAVGTVIAEFRDNAGSPVVLNAHHLIAGEQAVVPPSAEWQWQCTANQALQLNLSGAINTRGSVTFRVIGPSP